LSHAGLTLIVSEKDYLWTSAHPEDWNRLPVAGSPEIDFGEHRLRGLHRSQSQDFQQILSTERVDLCILCRSITSEQCSEALTIMGQLKPEIPILSLHPYVEAYSQAKHVRVLDVFISPGILIEAVSNLLNRVEVSQASA
jgi:hypothetical protein